MKTINVSCRPAPNQLLAYDSHYLHLSRRVSGAQLGLRRQEGLVLVVGVGGEENVLLDQFYRLLHWLGLTLSNGRGSVAGFECMCVGQSGSGGAWRSCVKVVTVCCLTDAVRKCDVFHQGWNSTSAVRMRECVCVSVHACGFILTCACVCVVCSD